MDQRKDKKYPDPDTILDYIEQRIVNEEQYYILLDKVQLLECTLSSIKFPFINPNEIGRSSF